MMNTWYIEAGMLPASVVALDVACLTMAATWQCITSVRFKVSFKSLPILFEVLRSVYYSWFASALAAFLTRWGSWGAYDGSGGGSASSKGGKRGRRFENGDNSYLARGFYSVQQASTALVACILETLWFFSSRLLWRWCFFVLVSFVSILYDDGRW